MIGHPFDQTPESEALKLAVIGQENTRYVVTYLDAAAVRAEQRGGPGSELAATVLRSASSVLLDALKLDKAWADAVLAGFYGDTSEFAKAPPAMKPGV